MAFPPIYFLAAVAAALATFLIASYVSTFKHRRRAASSATAAGLRYTPVDRFNLVARIANKCDVAAADVRIDDLTYGPRIRDTVYVVVARFTTGALRGTRRRTAAFVMSDSAGETVVREVDPGLALAEALSASDEKESRTKSFQ